MHFIMLLKAHENPMYDSALTSAFRPGLNSAASANIPSDNAGYADIPAGNTDYLDVGHDSDKDV
jgi:hypothetical protein